MQSQQDATRSGLKALLESAGARFAVARFRERAAIFRQGDTCDSVMCIETGRVWLAVATPGGREAICGVLGAGGFLGESVLDGHVVRPQTAIAMTTTEVLVIAKAQMSRLLHTQPAILDRFLAHLLSRTNRLQRDLCDQLLYSSEERLAHILFMLADCDGRRPCGCALPHISQESMAAMVGTTRARVNRFLVRFKQLGLIEQNRDGIHIRPSLLQVVHDDLGVENFAS